MSAQSLLSDAELVATILGLWRASCDTAQIGQRVGLPEASIYNILARLFDGGAP